MRKDIDAKRDQIISMLMDGLPRMEICRLLRCKYTTLKSRIDAWGLSHIKNPSRKNMPHLEARIHCSTFLEKDGRKINSHKLKTILIRDGLKEMKCEICGNYDWMGNKIPLELHHVNGDHWDNRIDNLKILCPNCHALTPNNSGRNVGRHA